MIIQGDRFINHSERDPRSFLERVTLVFQDLAVKVAKEVKVRRMVGLIIVTVVALSACQGSRFLVDTHPELNRHFRLGIDTPGEYPY